MNGPASRTGYEAARPGAHDAETGENPDQDAASVRDGYPLDVEALARRIVALLEHRPQPALPQLTATQLADELGVSAAWVREHAAELGGVRLGAGPKAPLRFHRDLVAERLTPRSGSGESLIPVSPAAKRSKTAPRAARSGTLVPLLPVRGSEAAK